MDQCCIIDGRACTSSKPGLKLLIQSASGWKCGVEGGLRISVEGGQLWGHKEKVSRAKLACGRTTASLIKQMSWGWTSGDMLQCQHDRRLLDVSDSSFSQTKSTTMPTNPAEIRKGPQNSTGMRFDWRHVACKSRDALTSWIVMITLCRKLLCIKAGFMLYGLHKRIWSWVQLDGLITWCTDPQSISGTSGG